MAIPFLSDISGKNATFAGTVDTPQLKVYPSSSSDTAGTATIELGVGSTKYWSLRQAATAEGDLVIDRTYSSANTEAFRIARSSGNATFAGLVTVGPGTTGSPYDATTFLHVKGTTRSIVQQSSTADAYYMFGDAAANNVAWLGYNHSTNQLSLHTSGTTYIDGNTTFAGNVTVPSLIATQDIYLNDGYNAANRYLLLRKNTANDGGIVMSSKAGSASATNDWQIVNPGSTRDLSFYAYGLGANALVLDRETGNATFAGTVTATHFYGDGSNLTGVTVSNADTVDNLHAASFLRSDADDTASGVITLNNTSTSATLNLSGHAGASNYNYFLKAANDGGTRAVHFVNGSTRTSDGGANTYTIRNDGGSLRLGNANYTTLLVGSGDLTYNANEVWHAGNDGSGSGLDADFLDGVQGSQFLRSDADDTATGIISVTKKLHDYDTIPPNQNLLDIGSIKIAGRDDIYGNATKTVITDYVAKYVNDNTGASTIRIYVDDNILVDGDPYMVSVYYENLIGSIAIDFADTAVTGNGSQTGTSSAPKSGRIYGHATRADYTSTFRFVDINLSQGSGHEVTLHSPKVEAGTTLTDFVATERTDMPTNSMHVRELIATSDATFAGDVGIGVTPGFKLHVKDDQDSTFNNGIAIERSNTTQRGYLNMQGGAFNIVSYDNVSTKFRVGNNGATTALELTNAGHAVFNESVHWDLSGGEYSGDPRAIVMGFSGGNYGSIGYNIAYTATSNSHTRVFGDIPTRMDLYDGILLYSSATGSAGSAISWTELLQCQPNYFEYKGNNIFYNGYSGNATFGGNITASSGTGHFSVVNASAYQLNGTYIVDSSRNLVNISSLRLGSSDAFIDTASTTSATATTVVASVAHATYNAAFFDFVIKNGTNVRSGTVYACHDGASTPLVEFAETSTVDLGDTSDVTLSVVISGANMVLQAVTTSSTWTIKSLIRAI